MKRINGEPVELVKDFGELKSGMIVWLASCGWCNGKHRGILGRLKSGLTVDPAGVFAHSDIFAFYPEVHGEPNGKGHLVISGQAVSCGRIYRVVDEQFDKEVSEVGTTSERSTTVHRAKTKVRQDR